MNITDFKKMKLERRKISMVTAYDYFSAQLVSSSGVDCILVGDSVAMVVHGFESTLFATLEMMVTHVSAVRRGAQGQAFIVGDMPFLSFRQGIHHAVVAAGRLMQAGAHSIKIEGLDGHEDVIHHCVQSGIPVMGHLGLTPQFIHQLGGYKVQGKEKLAQEKLIDQALRLEQLGCFALVLECVPAPLAQEITQKLSIPVIGIGAGKDTDGQVLVYHDLLGFNSEFKPKFVRKFADGHSWARAALKQFHEEVLNQTFPSESESYKA